MLGGVAYLSPADGVTALRSFPRRWRAALVPIDDPEVLERCHRIGPEGRSALDLLNDTLATLVLLGRALHVIVVTDEPVVAPAVVDPLARQWDGPTLDDVTEALAMLDVEAVELADRAEQIRAGEWSREATVADGRGTTVTAIEVLSEAVRTAADNLRRAERTLDAVR